MEGQHTQNYVYKVESFTTKCELLLNQHVEHVTIR
jgi:hypothetical protein